MREIQWVNCMLALSMFMMFPQFAGASEATSKAQFCSQNRKVFTNSFYEPKTRLSFLNPPGDLDMGLCWWHSLFQRSSLYLTVFRPELRRPTSGEATALIQQVIAKSNVVEIPGFKNMSEFSSAFEHEITEQLSLWQLRDGFLYQKWVIDLMGTEVTSLPILRDQMSRIYDAFQNDPLVPFLRIKLGRVVSHALLVIGIQRQNYYGDYVLQVIDSNLPGMTLQVKYQAGDQWLELEQDDIKQFVPHLAYQSDGVQIKSAISNYCRDVGGSRF